MLKTITILLSTIFVLELCQIECAPMIEVEGPKVVAKDRQLDFPGDNNDVPDRPQRPKPREGIISQILTFFRDLIGGRKRSNGDRGFNEGEDGGSDPGSRRESDGVFSFIRRTVSSFIDSLINVFDGNRSETPEANFPYNNKEPLKL